jgi:hypothetical protein
VHVVPNDAVANGAMVELKTNMALFHFQYVWPIIQQIIVESTNVRCNDAASQCCHASGQR